MNAKMQNTVSTVSNWVFWIVTIVLLVLISVNIKHNEALIEADTKVSIDQQKTIDKLVKELKDVEKKQSPPIFKKRIEEAIKK